mgnify:CR=1 FL=1
MMIHSFRQQHIKITYKDGETGEVGYLKPDAFMGRARSRWTMHPDMLKQYATCVSANLESNGVKDPELYFDVWKSMNERFVQRVYDPRIDIAHYEWHPMETPAYSMPLLHNLNNWRERLKELKQEIEDENIDVTFVADYPGLTLENFLAADLDNTTVELMGGSAFVSLDDQDGKEVPLAVGEKYHLPPGEFHTIHATGDDPVMYMYIYQNSTEIDMRKKYKALTQIDEHKANDRELPDNLTNLWTSEEEAKLREYFFGSEPVDLASKKDEVKNFKRSYYGQSLYWLDRKVSNLRRGLLLVGYSISDVVTGFNFYQEPPPDADLTEYYARLDILDRWVSPFKTILKTEIDKLAGDFPAKPVEPVPEDKETEPGDDTKTEL